MCSWNWSGLCVPDTVGGLWGQIPQVMVDGGGGRGGGGGALVRLRMLNGNCCTICRAEERGIVA